MMASQPYPPPSYPMSAQHNSRTGPYRVASVSQPAPSPYGYSASHQSSMYMTHPDMSSSYGLITPPTQTPPTLGSPLIAQGGYAPVVGGSNPWSSLSLSPISTDAHGFSYNTSPLMGSDPTCASPSEVLSTAQFLGNETIGLYPGAMTHHPGHGIFRQDHLDMGSARLLKPGHLLGPDGQPAVEVKKRSRTAQACERCRIRKARCFGGNPCNRCTKRRFVCEFSTQVRQRGPSNTKASAAAAAAAAAAAGTKTATTSPASKQPAAPRRHSMPDSTQSTPDFSNAPPMPTKTYSTSDVSTISTGTPVADDMPNSASTTPLTAYSVPNSAVLPQLPTLSTPDYLSVPAGPATAPAMTTATNVPGGSFSRPHTDGSLQGSNSDTRSPVFAFSPVSVDPSSTHSTATSGHTSSVSVDYPFTPISPVTTFSPTLGGMTQSMSYPPVPSVTHHGHSQSVDAATPARWQYPPAPSA